MEANHEVTQILELPEKGFKKVRYLLGFEVELLKKNNFELLVKIMNKSVI